MGNLTGKVAVITGAGSGLGLACAQRFAREGVAVVGYDLNETDQWEEIAKTAPKARFYKGDVTDGALQEKVGRETKDDFGSIDILVTSAGVAVGGPVHMVSEEDWDRANNINLKGTFLSIKSVIPAMMEQRAGSIITIASMEGLEGTEGGSAYNASKGGVVMLTKNVAIDYARVGIRCNCICPGCIDTPLWRSVFDQDSMAPYKESIRKQHKMNRFGQPEEIAGVAYFLASDDSSFVNGVALPVDGGYTAGTSHEMVELMGLV